MIELNNVTICAISNIDLPLHIRALKYSSQFIKFGKTIFISDEEINEPGIEWKKCKKIKSRQDYNFFMVNDFPQYIDTEFVLIVHDDGFITNPHKWTDIFLEYDYIGAPWPHEPHIEITGNMRVGNGGFSLRSKKLIDMPLNLNLPNRGMEIDIWNEDLYYCRNYKKTLEENGCKFAPLEVAKHFSYELTCEFENVEPLGFHGEWRKEFYDFENEHKRRANLRPHYYNWPL
jgi:hypothetical protein